MAQLLPAPYSYFTDANGLPLAGGKVYTYAAGTTTPQAAYTDAGGGTPLSNPVTLDSAGKAQIWLNGNYKIVVKDSAGNTISTTDNVSSFAGNMTTSTYDPALIAEQVVGLTATQTLTNKTLTAPVINTPTISSATFSGFSSALSPSGFVNKFRNAGFVINNRGTSAITVTAGTPAYTSDGWIVSCTGGNVTVTPTLVGSNSFKSFNRLLITGAASVSQTSLKQRIESYNCSGLKGQTITVQFLILNQTGASITPTIAINNPTVQDNYGATTSILAATNLQACADGAWTQVAYTFAGTGNEYLGLEVILEFGSSLNSGAKSVSVILPDIRATPGATTGLASSPPTPEILPIQTEEDLCGRYVQKSFPPNTAPAQNAGVTGAFSIFSESAATFGGFIPFMRRMRAAPTVTTYNPSAANANWRDVTVGADRAVTVGTIGTNGFVCSGGASAASSNNQIHYFATAEL